MPCSHALIHGSDKGPDPAMGESLSLAVELSQVSTGTRVTSSDLTASSLDLGKPRNLSI